MFHSDSLAVGALILYMYVWSSLVHWPLVLSYCTCMYGPVWFIGLWCSHIVHVHVHVCMVLFGSLAFGALILYMNKEKNLSPSQGLNLGFPNTSQMLLPLRHQDS